MPQNKINNPEGKNQYTEGFKSSVKPLQIQGGYSKEMLDRKKQEMLESQSKEMLVRSGTTIAKKSLENSISSNKDSITALNKFADRQTGILGLVAASGAKFLTSVTEKEISRKEKLIDNIDTFYKKYEISAKEADSAYIRALTKF